MRYVDLGTLPQKKKSKKNPFLKIMVIIFIVATIGYAAFLLFWPTTTIISKVLRAPMSALSFIRNPEGELKSTDGRTNILLLGIDKRSSIPYSYEGRDGKTYHNGFLSDTIIVASIDQTTKDLVMISIPRDFWVPIPGWNGMRVQSGKINSAYSIGDMYNYPGGGMILAKETISSAFDLPIHYAVRIDFNGFKKMVDTVGGVDIEVENSFDDWEYPIEGKEEANCSDGTYDCRYEHLRFEKGLQHMSGEIALKYARSRHALGVEGSDFARAKRQQKTIFALREKALSFGNLSDPMKAAQLIGDLGEAVETDLDVINFPPLQKLAQLVDISKARTLVLDPTIKNRTLIYNPSPGDYGGAWVIAPIGGSFEKINAYIQDFLAGNVSEDPATSSAPTARKNVNDYPRE